MGDRTRPADSGQKGRNRDHSLAPDRRREEPSVVPDHEPQVLDRVVLDDDLQARAALDLRDGVYSDLCYPWLETSHSSRYLFSVWRKAGTFIGHRRTMSSTSITSSSFLTSGP